jgi:hypothetical protein
LTAVLTNTPSTSYTFSTTVPSVFVTLTSLSSKSHSTLTQRFAAGYQRFSTHPCGRARRHAHPRDRREVEDVVVEAALSTPRIVARLGAISKQSG